MQSLAVQPRAKGGLISCIVHFLNRTKSTDSETNRHLLSIYGNNFQQVMDYFNTNLNTNTSSTLLELPSEQELQKNAPGSPKSQLNPSATTNRRQGPSSAMDVTDQVYHEPLKLSEFERLAVLLQDGEDLRRGWLNTISARTILQKGQPGDCRRLLAIYSCKRFQLSVDWPEHQFSILHLGTHQCRFLRLKTYL